MIVYPDCFPCFLRQSSIALDQAGITGPAQFELLKDISRMISSADLSGTPAHVTTHIHREIRARTGGDPFAGIKEVFNTKAMMLYDQMKEKVFSSSDPLFTASRLAIAGNIIDFGIFTSVNIEGTVQRALEGPIEIDDIQGLRQIAEGPKNVLYLLDNAGEIVFDMLLIEAIQRTGCAVTAVVKGGAVLNDALMDDALQVGLDRICRVIDNGSDAVGTILEMCPEGFVSAYQSADAVISKGQGNFETLMNEDRSDIFFLFQSKCDAVSLHLGLEKGSMVLAQGADRWRSVQ